jgi:hypothetical protein
MKSLDEDLRRACLQRLRRDWGCLNYWYLGEKLRPPAFELDEAETRLGSWEPVTRTISISLRHIESAPWTGVVETLKHEMAHQYVDEVLRLQSVLPHGEAFKRAADLLAIDHSGLGPAAAPQDEASSARLRKIRNLLKLAESSNVHEAEAALAKANELLLKYNIDMAATEQERRYAFRHLGQPTGRRSRYELILAGLLAEHFFVESIWIDTYEAGRGKAGHILEICGTPENVDLAEFTYHELLRSAMKLWRRHKIEAGITSNRDRRPYIEGVLIGFSDKLRAQREESARKHELIWLGDPGLDKFYRQRHPRIRNHRYAISAGVDAFGAGKAAGAALELTRAVRGAANGTRLLPG